MPATITYTGILTVCTCWCGISLAVPANLFAEAQNNEGKAIWCPVGHTFVFKERDADVQRRARRRAEDQAARLQAELDQTKASLRTTKGHVTRARKRAAAALCPVPGCKRQIVQLQRHLASKHPDWIAEHDHEHT